MATAVADLFITLRAETAPFISGLRGAGEEGESFVARMGGPLGVLNKVGAAATAAAAGVAVVSLKMAGDFQASMTKLVTTAGEAPAALKQVGDGILKMAVDTGTGTKELADGMYMVESAGFHGADGLKVLQAAAEGARSEQAPLAEVSNAVTSALKSYHLPASDAVTITNQMVAAVGHGKTTFGEFAGSLSTVLPIASSAGIGFDQIGGAIATLTNHGTSAREATQELANSIRNLQAPNNVAIQEMQRLGLSSIDISTNLGKRGLTGTIDMLQQAVLQHMGPAGTVMLNTLNTSKQASADLGQMLGTMKGPVQGLAQQLQAGTLSFGDYSKAIRDLPADQYTLGAGFATLYDKTQGFNSLLKAGGPSAQTFDDAMKKMMGGATGLNTALMLGGENAHDFQSNVAAVGEAGKGAGKDVEGWAMIQQTFNFKMSQLKELVETTGIKIGTALIPPVISVITWFTKHKQVAEDLAAVIGGVLAAAMLSFATSSVVSVVKGIGDIVKGLARAAVAVYEFATSEKVAAAASKIMAAGQAVLNAVMDANPIVLIVIAIAALVAGLIYAYYHCETFRKIVQTVFKAVKEAAEALWHALEAAWNGIVEGVEWLWRHIVNAWEIVRYLTVQTWHALSRDVADAWHAIERFFVSAWHAVADPIVAAWNWIENITSTVWNRITAFFAKWWPLLLVIFAFPIAVLIAAWNHLHKSVEDIAIAAWNAISDFFAAAWHDIADGAATVWGLIQDYIWHPMVDLWHWLVGLWNDLMNWLAGVWHSITQIAAAAWRAVADGASVVWSLIQDYIWHPMVDVWHWLVSLWNSLTGWLGEQWRFIVAIAQIAWQDIKSAVVNPLKEAWQWVVSIVSNIGTSLWNGFVAAWNTVKDVGSWFVGIGTAIVNGIISGVESAGSGLLKSVKGLANSALSGVKSVLGISSPSREFASQVGRWIPAGIAQGVEDYAHVAHGAVTALAGSLPTAALGSTSALSVASAASGAGSGQTIVVNVTVQGSVLSERDLRDVMERQMYQLGMRNSTTWQNYTRR